jgi:hypothetical protein
MPAPPPSAVRYYPPRTYGEARRLGWRGRRARLARREGRQFPDRRQRLLLVGGWSVLWCLIFLRGGAYSWHYFANGAVLLFGGHPSGLAAPGGLHLYANYPQYQIGPLSFLVAAVVQPLGSWAGQLLILAIGAVVIAVAESFATGRTDLQGARRLVVAELLFVPLWAELAIHFTHLDDALVLGAGATAVWALHTGRDRWLGALLGAAVAAKPWAAVFLPLVLALPSPQRLRGLVWSLGIPVVAWLPFVVSDPSTIWSTSQFTIANAADSSLRALGVGSARTPGWDRTAQLLLGLVVGAAAVVRRRWAAVLLAGIAVRLLLDPGSYAYYTAGIMVAALLVDVLLTRGPVPITSVVGFTGLFASKALPLTASQSGMLRLLTCAALVVSAVVGRKQGAVRRPNARAATRLSLVADHER